MDLKYDNVELSDCYIEPPDDDGAIRRRDTNGNLLELRRPIDPDYHDWAELFTQVVNLGIHGIEVTVVGNTPSGGGITCNDDLFTVCPHCTKQDCCYQCGESTADFTPASSEGGATDDLCMKPEEEGVVAARLQGNAAVRALLTMILAHACAGIDIELPDYKEGIESALDEISNKYGD